MFSNINFLLPVSPGDKSLRIVYSNGKLAHIIRDASCTIRQDGVNILIKQQSESNTITLNFASVDECKAAHLALREALITMGTSIAPTVPVAQEYNFNPATTTTVGVAYTVNIPIAAVVVHGIYVNGILVPNIYSSVTLLLSGIQSVFTWNSTAEYILEPSDLVTIKYN
jgi:hypothetical protein